MARSCVGAEAVRLDGKMADYGGVLAVIWVVCREPHCPEWFVIPFLDVLASIRGCEEACGLVAAASEAEWAVAGVACGLAYEGLRRCYRGCVVINDEYVVDEIEYGDDGIDFEILSVENARWFGRGGPTPHHSYTTDVG